MWLGLSWKVREKCVFWLFFKIGLCSAISFKRSQRELSIDVAQHESILKNKGKVRILVVFQDRPMFSHIIQKVSRREFSIWLSIGLCWKIPKYVLPPFYFHTHNRLNSVKQLLHFCWVFHMWKGYLFNLDVTVTWWRRAKKRHKQYCKKNTWNSSIDKGENFWDKTSADYQF